MIGHMQTHTHIHQKRQIRRLCCGKCCAISTIRTSPACFSVAKEWLCFPAHTHNQTVFVAVAYTLKCAHYLFERTEKLLYYYLFAIVEFGAAVFIGLCVVVVAAADILKKYVLFLSLLNFHCSLSYCTRREAREGNTENILCFFFVCFSLCRVSCNVIYNIN